jgi:serine/threonine protein kinase
MFFLSFRYPPEVFKFRRFNEKSDSWSFGVLVWEAFSNGDVPYGVALKAQSYNEVKLFFENIEKGKLKLKKVDKCPLEIFKLMNSCLNISCDLRPNFNEILNRLEIECSRLATVENNEHDIETDLIYKETSKL